MASLTPWLNPVGQGVVPEEKMQAIREEDARDAVSPLQVMFDLLTPWLNPINTMVKPYSYHGSTLFVPWLNPVYTMV